jgi:hypothetical protein
MMESLLNRMINRAILICESNPKSKECKIAWKHVEALKKSPPRKK